MKTMNLTLAAIAIAVVASTSAFAAGNGDDAATRRADSPIDAYQAQDSYRAPATDAYQAPATRFQAPDATNHAAPHVDHENNH